MRIVSDELRTAAARYIVAFVSTFRRRFSGAFRSESTSGSAEGTDRSMGEDDGDTRIGRCYARSG